MTNHHYRDLIRRAVMTGNGQQLNLLAEQLADAARSREILRAKGYGAIGMNASITAAQVPEANLAALLNYCGNAAERVAPSDVGASTGLKGMHRQDHGR